MIQPPPWSLVEASYQLRIKNSSTVSNVCCDGHSIIAFLLYLTILY